MRVARLVVQAALASCGVFACSAEGREDAARSAAPVIGGTTDTAHAAVVSIQTTPDAARPELCTGTVIAPRVVLTAGHCTFGQDPATLNVGFGGSAENPSRVVAVAAVITYPDYTGAFADLEAGLDLGALVLAEDAGVAPLAVSSADARAFVGGDLVIVGFGQSDASDLETRGTKRRASVHVGAACSALLSFGDATTNGCHGDSGGPLLAPAADGGGESIVGVVSYGDELHCATPTRAVRVDRYAAWIASVVAGTNDGGACGTCPPRATDCASVDAGKEAAADADAATADAASVDATGGGELALRGGCAVGSSSPNAGIALAWMTLAWLAKRRRPTRSTP